MDSGQGGQVLSFCVYNLHRNCNTMQSCCVSIVSVRKAIILKARYKILFDSVRQQVEYYVRVVACSFYQ